MTWYRGLPGVWVLLGTILIQSQHSGAVNYEKCLRDLYEADVDGNFLLTRDEYMNFIEKRSDGSINVSAYENLPLALITNFNFAACMCSQYGIGIPGCCVGDRARIDLDPSNSPMVISDSLYTFCLHIDLVIGAYETPGPTPVPSNKPSYMPSFRPSVHPTGAPTSNSPSASPFTLSSLPPSVNPSMVATPMPTIMDSKETQNPTPQTLVCFSFQYATFNNAGLDAQDLWFERNNTLKTGLESAARNITIRALNATYPRDEESTRLLLESTPPRARMSKSRPQESPQHKSSEGTVQGCASSNPNKNSQLVVVPDTRGQGRTASGGTNENSLRRRLVLYTNDHAIEITAIVDNRFCAGASPEMRCAIVSTSVCATLEEGDEKDGVKQAILDAVERAIATGEFEDAIPPENRLPNL